MSTPVKPASTSERSVSPLVTNTANGEESDSFQGRLQAVEAVAIQQAEMSSQTADRILKKRGSEVMFSSDVEEDGEQLSFIKYLSPKSAALVKKSFESLAIGKSPARKDLNIA